MDYHFISKLCQRECVYHVIWKLKDISIQLYTETITEHKNPSLLCGAKNKLNLLHTVYRASHTLISSQYT